MHSKDVEKYDEKYDETLIFSTKNALNIILAFLIYCEMQLLKRKIMIYILI